MGIDSLIFDMDGTVVLSRDFALSSVFEGTQQVFRERGIDLPLPSQETILANIGKPSVEFFRSLFPELDQRLRDEIQQRIYAVEERMLAAGAGSFAPGAPGALEELRAMGLRLALVSNAGTRYFRMNIEAFHLDRYFDAMLCSGQRGYPPKSAIIREVALTIGAKKAAVVGDRRYDIEAAVECGMVPIGCVYGYGEEEEIAAARLLIGSLDELVELFGR